MMKKTPLALVGAVVASASLFGCGPQPPEAGEPATGPVPTQVRQAPPDESATVEQGIIGGITTLARPEIGRLYTTAGMCTGTLVLPNYVITAGHCVSQGVTASDTFYVSRADGTWAFGVLRAHYLMNDPGDTLFSGHASDLALVQLASSVPSWLATPATLSDLRAVGGSSTVSTKFGYGCTDRNSQSGVGTKRYATFTGDGSDVLCPGDSGGPSLFGNGEGANPLWGINSGYGWTWFNSWDINADAAYYKKLVEGLAAAWDAEGLERNANRGGADYRSLSTTSAASCASICRGESNLCRAFTYVPSSATCWLKNATPSLTPSEGLVSGINRGYYGPAFEQNYNRPGGDYTSFRYSGGDDVCARRCEEEDRCQAFSLVTLSTGERECYLKDQRPNPRYAAGIVSGLKRGMEFETDRPGADYRVLSLSEAWPEKCQTECIRDGQCQAWTWAPKRPGANATCWLKNSVPAATRIVGSNLVSGTRDAWRK